MHNRRLVKRFSCLLLAASLVLSGTNIPMTIQAKTTVKYYNTKKTITFKDSKGIRKCLVNGKSKKVKAGAKKVKITFKKEGKYVVKITNRKKKVTSRTIYIDKTAPTITGVKNGETYTGAVTVAAKDKYGIASFKVNGQKVKSHKATIAEGGTYDLLAEDKAGNVRKITFSITSAQPETTTGAAVSSSAVTSGSSTNALIPNVPAFPNGPVVSPVASTLPGLPANDNTNSQVPDKMPTIGCNHLWMLQTVEEPATCYSSGIAKYVCFSCGGTKRDEIPKVAHDFTNLVTDARYEVTPVTCTGAGVYFLSCKYCGEKSTETKEVQPIGHIFKRHIAADDYLKDSAIPNGHGDIYYLVCEHCDEHSTSDADTWDNGRKVNHTVHTFTDTSVANESNRAKQATCSDPARYFYKCTDCDTFASDSDLTFEDGEPLDHVFQEVLKEKATCEKGNLYVKKCTRPNCGVCEEGSERYDDNALGHYFQEIVRDDARKSEATCQVKALYYKTCARSECNEKSNETFYAGELAEHKFVKSNKVVKEEADCSHPRRYYETCIYEGCSEKGEVYDSEIKGEQTKKHEYVRTAHEDYHVVDADCSHGTGYNFACRNCKSADTTRIWYDNDILQHNYKETNDPQYLHMVPGEEATCTEPAKYYKVCTMCHAPSNSKESIFSAGSPKGHDFRIKTIIKTATPTENQTYKIKCSRCDEFETENAIEEPNTYTDHTAPAIYWNYTCKDGAAIGHNGVKYTIPVSDPDAYYTSTTCAGDFNITVVDDGGSGIKSIEWRYLFDNNPIPFSYEQFNYKYDSTAYFDRGEAKTTFSGVLFGNQDKDRIIGKYNYIIIKVEDLAGNVNYRRTANIVPTLVK